VLVKNQTYILKSFDTKDNSHTLGHNEYFVETSSIIIERKKCAFTVYPSCLFEVRLWTSSCISYSFDWVWSLI